MFNKHEKTEQKNDRKDVKKKMLLAHNFLKSTYHSVVQERERRKSKEQDE